jgi:hypothetical protein
MGHYMLRRIAVVVAVLVAGMAATGTANAKTQSLLGFDSCAAVRAAVPIAADGNYVLDTGTHLVPVYCHDMAGTPEEFVSLPAVNFSQYTAGGAAAGTDVRTTYTKLRVDPATLTVDINDTTFATSTGRISQTGTVVTSMPYGVGASCDFQPSGVGRIDLTGTAFLLADTFVVAGFRAVGGATVSADNRTADLAGGGYCGWIAPAPYIYGPVNPDPAYPDFHLELACGPYNLVDLLLGRACVTR